MCQTHVPNDFGHGFPSRSVVEQISFNNIDLGFKFYHDYAFEPKLSFFNLEPKLSKKRAFIEFFMLE